MISYGVLGSGGRLVVCCSAFIFGEKSALNNVPSTSDDLEGVPTYAPVLNNCLRTRHL